MQKSIKIGNHDGKQGKRKKKYTGPGLRGDFFLQAAPCTEKRAKQKAENQNSGYPSVQVGFANKGGPQSAIARRDRGIAPHVQDLKGVAAKAVGHPEWTQRAWNKRKYRGSICFSPSPGNVMLVRRIDQKHRVPNFGKNNSKRNKAAFVSVVCE